MTDRKFLRVNDKLYEEHSTKGAQSLKWTKVPEPLYLELYDVTAIDGVAAGLKVLDEGAVTAELSELRAIKQIRGKGKVANERNIGFIDTEGLTSSGLLDTPTVDVELHGVVDEDLRQHWNGHLGAHAGARTQFSLGMVIPKSAFDEAWSSIRSGAAHGVSLAIYADVFQSEMERHLGDPGMSQVYYIEKESGTAVTFSELRVSSAPLISEPIEPQDQQKISPELAVLNRIAGATRILAGGMVAVAILLLVRLF